MSKKAKNGSAWTIPDHWPVQDQAAYWPLAKFVPYERNVRTHPPAQVALLAELLKKYGPDQPIVVDEDDVILKGHGRRLAALAAGMEIFTFVRRDGLSESDKRAMRISDNQVALLSGYDQELIRGEIAMIQSEGYDVALLGFGEAQLVSFMTTPGPPSEFREFGEDIETDFCCPKCGWRWSGNPNPDVIDASSEGSEQPATGKKPASGRKAKSR